jgi:8-oxo-dGTP pyrophosphatase MutT (NUDIX family)
MNQKSPWKIKSSQVVYANPWIKVNEHQVINPAGNDGIYTVVEFQNIAIAILPIDQDGYTYLVGQYRFSLNSYEWEIPEGGCPLGTEPLATAQRELQEECGLLAQHYECILQMQLYSNPTNTHQCGT